MFTGLIQERGELAAVEPLDAGVRLTVRAKLAAGVAVGDSVSVNGVCLTATSVERDQITAELSTETVARTTLGSLQSGTPLNLELPLRLDSLLGGHLVQGHVDGIGEVVAAVESGTGRELRFAVAAELMRYVVEKGSVAVDGVSLTATQVDEGGFSAFLIPETLQRTNLGQARDGTRVNLELDVIGKYVEKLARP